MISMTAQEFAEVVAQVRSDKTHDFSTDTRWNDHLSHDLPPAPAPEGVDEDRYEALVY